MYPQLLILNGGSSAGKSSIVRELQARLPLPWLATGVDHFTEMLPPDGDIRFEPDGRVLVGQGFRTLERVWMLGVAEMARSGTGVIVDEVFLSGAASQQRWQAALNGVQVAWVGVYCHPDEAERREQHRPDRVPGMARLQAQAVHTDVVYDLLIDTTHSDPASCADTIAKWLEGRAEGKT